MPTLPLKALPEPAVSPPRAYGEADVIDFGPFEFKGCTVRITLLANGRARVEREEKPARENFACLAKYLWHRLKSWMGLAGGDAWLLGKRECADAISARWAQARCAGGATKGTVAGIDPTARTETDTDAHTNAAQQALVGRPAAQAGLHAMPTELLEWIVSFLPLRDRVYVGRFLCRDLQYRLAYFSSIEAATMVAGVADSALTVHRSCEAMQDAAAGPGRPLPASAQLALLQVLISRLPFVPAPQYMAAWGVLFTATAAVDTTGPAQLQAQAELSEALARALPQAGERNWDADAASSVAPISSPPSMASAVLALLAGLCRSGRLDRLNAWLPDAQSCFALSHAVPACQQKQALGTALRSWLVKSCDGTRQASYSRAWVAAVEHLTEHADAFSPAFRALALAELATLLPGGDVGLMRLPLHRITVEEDPHEAARHWTNLLKEASALPREAAWVVVIALAGAIRLFCEDRQGVGAAIRKLDRWIGQGGGDPAGATSVQAMLLLYQPKAQREAAWQRLWEQAKNDRTGICVVDVAAALYTVPAYAGWEQVLDYCRDDAAPATRSNARS